MKKIYTIVVALLASAGSLHAQAGSGSLKAENIVMTRVGENVTVAFTLSAGEKVTKATDNLVVNPFLSGRTTTGQVRRQLAPVIIRGSRAKALDGRHELATGKRHYEQIPQYMKAGGSLEYTVTVPYEEWMRGGELIFEGVGISSGSSTEVDLGLVAENILYAEPEIETTIVEVPTVMSHTTGEQLAEQYQFVAPASEFEVIRQLLEERAPGSSSDSGRDEISQQRIMAEIRKGSISIFFAQSRRAIDSNFGDNNKNLVELISAVRALAGAEDTKIAAIVIAGFSSPEGSPEFNDRLALERATVVKEFLTDNSDVDPNVIRIFNGGADWTGLKELVEQSNMGQKQRVIDIIESTPIRGSQRNLERMGELRRLDGGEPYRYMFTNFFPQLRQAAYIKVYYEEK